MNGVNIPLDAYCYEAGIPLPAPDKPGQSVKWIYPPSYLRFVTRSAVVAGAFRRRRSATGRIQNPCWSFGDLAPSAIFLLEWIRKLWSAIRWREFFGQPSHASSPASVQPPEANLEPAPRQPVPAESDAQDTSRFAKEHCKYDQRSAARR